MFVEEQVDSIQRHLLPLSVREPARATLAYDPPRLRHIFELRPESLEGEGAVAALAKQAAALEARYGIRVEIDLCDEPEAPLEAKETLYRIAQEALHNTVKHARAKGVRIKMERGSEDITLEISDDGAGFDSEGDFPGHLGLRSMRERALRLGGTLEVDSVPGKGTRIRALIPI
jgi:signal transduction histidine kinase